MSTTTTVALLLRVVYLLLMPSLIDERRLVITLPHVAGSAVAIALASPGSTAISLSPYQAVLHRMSREVPWCRSVNVPCGGRSGSSMGCVPVSLDSLVRPVTAVPLLLASRLLRPLAQWRPHPSISYVLTLVPEVLTSLVVAGPLLLSQPAGKVLPPR